MEESIKGLQELFDRDLGRLHENIEGMPESDIWQNYPGVTNSCGVLSQHIVGNLRHFIGSVLGDTGYERDRQMEFTNTGRSRDELLEDITKARETIRETLQHLDSDKLYEPYPLDLSFDYTTYEFLLHLYGHLNYHLGQINYLGRILGSNKS